MVIIGITGGIATGKSLITNELINRGYFVIDTDKMAHELLESSFVINELINAFSIDIITNNKVDRKKLGKLIFNNKDKQLLLNNIVHPLVINKVKDIIKNTNEELVFVDVPLLFESKLNEIMDKIIVVSINYNNQIKRLIKRDQIDEGYALLKINSQMPVTEKEKLADYIIDNNNSIENSINQLEEILRRIKNEI